jgi:hypothetical protein
VVLLEEPRLVREHDRLRAVTEVEFLKDVRDVRLDGGLADGELVSDLRVRKATSQQAKDSFAITELVEFRGDEPDATCGPATATAGLPDRS